MPNAKDAAKSTSLAERPRASSSLSTTPRSVTPRSSHSDRPGKSASRSATPRSFEGTPRASQSVPNRRSSDALSDEDGADKWFEATGEVGEEDEAEEWLEEDWAEEEAEEEEDAGDADQIDEEVDLNATLKLPPDAGQLASQSEGKQEIGELQRLRLEFEAAKEQLRRSLEDSQTSEQLRRSFADSLALSPQDNEDHDEPEVVTTRASRRKPKAKRSSASKPSVGASSAFGDTPTNACEAPSQAQPNDAASSSTHSQSGAELPAQQGLENSRDATLPKKKTKRPSSFKGQVQNSRPKSTGQSSVPKEQSPSVGSKPARLSHGKNASLEKRHSQMDVRGRDVSPSGGTDKRQSLTSQRANDFPSPRKPDVQRPQADGSKSLHGDELDRSIISRGASPSGASSSPRLREDPQPPGSPFEPDPDREPSLSRSPPSSPARIAAQWDGNANRMRDARSREHDGVERIRQDLRLVEDQIANARFQAERAEQQKRALIEKLLEPGSTLSNGKAVVPPENSTGYAHHHSSIPRALSDQKAKSAGLASLQHRLASRRKDAAVKIQAAYRGSFTRRHLVQTKATKVSNGDTLTRNAEARLDQWLERLGGESAPQFTQAPALRPVAEVAPRGMQAVTVASARPLRGDALGTNRSGAVLVESAFGDSAPLQRGASESKLTSRYPRSRRFEQEQAAFLEAKSAIAIHSRARRPVTGFVVEKRMPVDATQGAAERRQHRATEEEASQLPHHIVEKARSVTPTKEQTRHPPQRVAEKVRSATPTKPAKEQSGHQQRLPDKSRSVTPVKDRRNGNARVASSSGQRHRATSPEKDTMRLLTESGPRQIPQPHAYPTAPKPLEAYLPPPPPAEALPAPRSAPPPKPTRTPPRSANHTPARLAAQQARAQPKPPPSPDDRPSAPPPPPWASTTAWSDEEDVPAARLRGRASNADMARPEPAKGQRHAGRGAGRGQAGSGRGRGRACVRHASLSSSASEGEERPRPFAPASTAVARGASPHRQFHPQQAKAAGSAKGHGAPAFAPEPNVAPAARQAFEVAHGGIAAKCSPPKAAGSRTPSAKKAAGRAPKTTSSHAAHTAAMPPAALEAQTTPPELPDGQVYTGFRNKEGLREGFGVMRLKDGSIYNGQWRQDRRDGRGTLFFEGGVLEGEWGNGGLQGEGKIHFKNGDRFEGSYTDNKKYGPGVYRWQDGAEESGEYLEGQKHGWHRLVRGPDSWDLLYEQGSVVIARKNGFLYDDDDMPTAAPVPTAASAPTAGGQALAGGAATVAPGYAASGGASTPRQDVRARPSVKASSRVPFAQAPPHGHLDASTAAPAPTASVKKLVNAPSRSPRNSLNAAQRESKDAPEVRRASVKARSKSPRTSVSGGFPRAGSDPPQAGSVFGLEGEDMF